MSAAHRCDQETWLRSLPLPEFFWLAKQAGCSVANFQASLDDLMMRSHTKLRAVMAARLAVA